MKLTDFPTDRQPVCDFLLVTLDPVANCHPKSVPQ